jgi:hypothetical protein
VPEGKVDAGRELVRERVEPIELILWNDLLRPADIREAEGKQIERTSASTAVSVRWSITACI